MPRPSPAFEANDLDASAAIDLERAAALRAEADGLDKAAATKRARAEELRKQAEATQERSRS